VVTQEDLARRVAFAGRRSGGVNSVANRERQTIVKRGSPTHAKELTFQRVMLRSCGGANFALRGTSTHSLLSEKHIGTKKSKFGAWTYSGLDGASRALRDSWRARRLLAGEPQANLQTDRRWDAPCHQAGAPAASHQHPGSHRVRAARQSASPCATGNAARTRLQARCRRLRRTRAVAIRPLASPPGSGTRRAGARQRIADGARGRQRSIRSNS
jgi:hypothetical protein